jgi:hypothetical protein
MPKAIFLIMNCYNILYSYKFVLKMKLLNNG